MLSSLLSVEITIVAKKASRWQTGRLIGRPKKFANAIVMLSKLALNLSLDESEIRRRRQQIAQRLMSDSDAIRDINFETINTQDLFELFANYDELFFEGQLATVFESADHLLKFRLSSRMTSTGGMTTYHRSRAKRNAAGRFGRGRRSQPESRRHFEIAISSTLLFNTTFESQRIKVGGVATFHRLDALQRIFEHELVHLLEMVVWDDSSCARWRFKSIAERFFGHLESNHQLLTPSETARSEYGITSGDMVKFHHKGIQLTGVVNSINRRATVLVARDKSGELFDDNRRYQRFYVPLERLSRVG